VRLVYASHVRADQGAGADCDCDHNADRDAPKRGAVNPDTAQLDADTDGAELDADHHADRDAGVYGSRTDRSARPVNPRGGK
jgi:hypothetical protein